MNKKPIDYKTFKKWVMNKHKDDKYAKILYADCSNLSVIKEENIPCWCWCLLTYQWPIIAQNYIKAVESL